MTNLVSYGEGNTALGALGIVKNLPSFTAILAVGNQNSIAGFSFPLFDIHWVNRQAAQRCDYAQTLQWLNSSAIIRTVCSVEVTCLIHYGSSGIDKLSRRANE